MKLGYSRIVSLTQTLFLDKISSLVTAHNLMRRLKLFDLYTDDNDDGSGGYHKVINRKIVFRTGKQVRFLNVLRKV